MEAAASAVARRGDGSWSLADVAAVAGVTPAALVKRFGSRQGLLVGLVTSWVEQLPAYTAERVDDPVEHVREWVADWAASTSGPSTAVGHLTLLLDEVVDTQARALLVEGRRRQTAYLRAALDDGRRRGHLATAPPEGAVELWLDLLAGATIACAIDQSDRPAARALAFIDKDIDSWRNA